MAYQLRHLQITADYIANQLKYANDDERKQNLTKSDKKWVTTALLQVLDPIQKSNPKVIVINPDNKKLISYFEYLEKNNIQFPMNTTYLLKRSGESYECKDGAKSEIYNRHKVKNKIAASRIDELTQRLKEMTVDECNVDDEYQSDEDAGATYTPYQALHQNLTIGSHCSAGDTEYPALERRAKL
jgi:hypothetical protein